MNDSPVQPAEHFLINGPPGHNRPARNKSSAQTLRDRDDVRLKIPVLKGPPFPGAPHPALHFVANHQRSMRPAERLRSLIKIVTRKIHAFPLNRFEEKGCNIPLLQKLFQFMQVAQTDAGHVSQERPETFLEIHAARQGTQTERKPMVTAFQADDLRSTGGGSGELDCAFNRLGPGITEKDRLEM